MLRFLSRFLGVWLLAAALVLAVVDGARSIAASTLVLTPLAETLARLAPKGGASGAVAAVEPASGPWPLDIVSASLLAAPTAAVLLVLAVLLLTIGRRRGSRRLGREFAV